MDRTHPNYILTKLKKELKASKPTTLCSPHKLHRLQQQQKPTAADLWNPTLALWLFSPVKEKMALDAAPQVQTSAPQASGVKQTSQRHKSITQLHSSPTMKHWGWHSRERHKVISQAQSSNVSLTGMALLFHSKFLSSHFTCFTHPLGKHNVTVQIWTYRSGLAKDN